MSLGEIEPCDDAKFFRPAVLAADHPHTEFDALLAATARDGSARESDVERSSGTLALLGTPSKRQAGTFKAATLTPRGRSRSTRKRVPSLEATESHARSR